MKEATLPSPGLSQRGFHLRRLMAQVISQCELDADKRTTGASPHAAVLNTFLDACKAAVTETGKLRGAPTVSPATADVIGTSTQQITAVDGGHDGVETFTSSDTAVATVNSSGLVTGVAIGTASITIVWPATATHRKATRTVTIRVVAATAPVNTVLPAVTGTARLGQTLTTTNGTWTGTPTPTFTRQWQKKTGAGAWTAISGATALTYVIAVPVVVGDLIRCVVTGNSAGATAEAISNETAAVIAA